MINFKKEIAGHERLLITQALEACQNEKKAAAKLLGLSYRAFRYQFNKHFGKPEHTPK